MDTIPLNAGVDDTHTHTHTHTHTYIHTCMHTKKKERKKETNKQTCAYIPFILSKKRVCQLDNKERYLFDSFSSSCVASF
jgi:hypothetical protein